MALMLLILINRKSRSKTPDKKKRSVSPEAKKLTHREGEITVKDEPLDKVGTFLITLSPTTLMMDHEILRIL